MKDQMMRIETQKQLSEVIAVAAGELRHKGLTDRMIHKLFYVKFDKTISPPQISQKDSLIPSPVLYFYKNCSHPFVLLQL